jgi:hypothetical protein
MTQQHINHDEEQAETATTLAWAPLRWTAPVAVLAAATAVGILFVVMEAVGAFPSTVTIPPASQPLTLSTAVGTAIVSAVGGCLVFAALTRVTASPIKQFRRIASGVLVLSFVTPFTIPGAPVAMIASLLFLHVVVAGVVVGTLTYRGTAE